MATIVFKLVISGQLITISVLHCTDGRTVTTHIFLIYHRVKNRTYRLIRVLFSGGGAVGQGGACVRFLEDWWTMPSMRAWP